MSGDTGAGSPPVVGFWEVLAFGCELAMLATLALAGWSLAPSSNLAVALAFALPAVTGLGWGIWLAPRARRRLRGPARALTKIVVFLLAGTAFAVAGHPVLAAGLTVVSVGDTLVLSRREALAARS
jgi:uncharacterized iron-regulated membrane protein